MTVHGVWPVRPNENGERTLFHARVFIVLLIISVVTAITSSFGYYTLAVEMLSQQGENSGYSSEFHEYSGIKNQIIIAGAYGFLMSASLVMVISCILRMQLAGPIRLFRKASGISYDENERRGIGCLNMLRELEDDLTYLLRISENERRLRSLLDSVSDAVITIDQTGIVKSFNSVAEKTFGYKADEVVGNNISMLMPSPDRENHDRYIQNYIETGTSTIIDKGRVVTGLRKDGSCFDLHLEVSEWKTDTGERLFSGIMWDVSEQKAAHAELEFRATYDQLTGIYNRSAGSERLDVEMIRSERYDCYLSVVMLDIDYFKQINDCYGHQRGDEVIKRLVSVISKNIREIDVFVRWGGEEFLIILPETGLAGAELMALKLCDTIEQTQFGLSEKVTVSMGVTSYKSADTVEQLLQRVDAALYEAKYNGRNCVRTVVDDNAHVGPYNVYENVVIDNLDD